MFSRKPIETSTAQTKCHMHNIACQECVLQSMVTKGERMDFISPCILGYGKMAITVIFMQ